MNNFVFIKKAKLCLYNTIFSEKVIWWGNDFRITPKFLNLIKIIYFDRILVNENHKEK